MSEEQEKQKKLGNRKKSQPDDKTLHRLIYEEGKTRKEISQIYKVAISTVGVWVGDAKKRNPEMFSKRAHSVRNSPPDIDTLKQLYLDEGKTYRDIAKQYNVSRTLVMLWMRDANTQEENIPIRKSKRPDEISAETLKSLYIDQKLTAKEIAEMYNVSGSTVSLWLKKEREEHPEINLRKKQNRRNHIENQN